MTLGPVLFGIGHVMLLPQWQLLWHSQKRLPELSSTYENRPFRIIDRRGWCTSAEVPPAPPCQH